jgi:protein ImuB
VKEQLFSLRLPGAVTGLRLAALEVAPIASEQLAFGDRPEALDALEGVLARLAVRLGGGALFAAEPVDRHRPEGAYRAVPFRPERGRRQAAPPRAERRLAAPALPLPAVAEAAAPDGEPGPPAAPPVPAIPYAREPAAPPDGPPRPTRLLAAPVPVVAEGEGGRLTALRLGDRARAVLAMDGPERLRGEWWASPFDRDYYRVRLDGLGDCWVYRDGRDGRLYLHGFFD